ncbi:MAG TPA: hypothetical protein VI318_03155 [Baekduia sp.]
MSIAQGNDEGVIEVDRTVGEVLRQQTLVVLEANHHYFEDVTALSPAGRRALRDIYADAFAVLDAVGWGDADDPPPPGRVEVPLTAGHMAQLARRRRDLGHTNIDRLDLDGPDADATALTADRQAALVLDRLQADYARARACHAPRA